MADIFANLAFLSYDMLRAEQRWRCNWWVATCDGTALALSIKFLSVLSDPELTSALGESCKVQEVTLSMFACDLCTRPSTLPPFVPLLQSFASI